MRGPVHLPGTMPQGATAGPERELCASSMCPGEAAPTLPDLRVTWMVCHLSVWGGDHFGYRPLWSRHWALGTRGGLSRHRSRVSQGTGILAPWAVSLLHGTWHGHREPWAGKQRAHGGFSGLGLTRGLRAYGKVGKPGFEAGFILLLSQKSTLGFWTKVSCTGMEFEKRHRRILMMMKGKKEHA